MPPTKAQLAKIHIAKKELGLSDEIYRDILYLNFDGANSSSKLTEQEAAGLLDIFRAKGWKQKRAARPRGKRRDGNYIVIKPGPAAKQQRKVLAMWNALGYGMDKLHIRVKKQFGVERFEWLTDGRALHVLITDLKKRLEAMRDKR